MARTCLCKLKTKNVSRGSIAKVKQSGLIKELGNIIAH